MDGNPWNNLLCGLAGFLSLQKIVKVEGLMEARANQQIKVQIRPLAPQKAVFIKTLLALLVLNLKVLFRLALLNDLLI